MPCGPATVATYDLNVGDNMVLLAKENVQVQMEGRPFAKGGCREAYICRIADASTGFMFGPRLIAKRYIRKEEFLEDYICAHMAHTYARKFNERNPPKRIRFLVPNRIMTFNGVRYSLEEFLEGRWEKHNNIFGMMESSHSTAQAFSHFTWEASGQKLMILDVQGVGETFTDPAIVSTSQGMYGYTDTGMTGISEFFRTHKCTPICSAVGNSMYGGGGRAAMSPEPAMGMMNFGAMGGNFSFNPNRPCQSMSNLDCLGLAGCSIPRSPCVLSMADPMMRREGLVGANVLKPLNVAPAARLAPGLSGMGSFGGRRGNFLLPSSSTSGFGMNVDSGFNVPVAANFGGRIISV